MHSLHHVNTLSIPRKDKSTHGSDAIAIAEQPGWDDAQPQPHLWLINTPVPFAKYLMLQSHTGPPQTLPVKAPIKEGGFKSPTPMVSKLYGGSGKYVASVVANIENQARIEPYWRAENATAGMVNRI